MATKKQVDANKKNAQKSTGPATIHGKMRSRRNAMRHGLAGSGVAMPVENELLAEHMFVEMTKTMHVPHVAQQFMVKQLAREAVKIEAISRARTINQQALIQDYALDRENGNEHDRRPPVTLRLARRLTDLKYYRDKMLERDWIPGYDYPDLIACLQNNEIHSDEFIEELDQLRARNDKEGYRQKLMPYFEIAIERAEVCFYNRLEHTDIMECARASGLICGDLQAKIPNINDYEERAHRNYLRYYKTLEQAGAFPAVPVPPAPVAPPAPPEEPTPPPTKKSRSKKGKTTEIPIVTPLDLAKSSVPGVRVPPCMDFLHFPVLSEGFVKIEFPQEQLDARAFWKSDDRLPVI